MSRNFSRFDRGARGSHFPTITEVSNVAGGGCPGIAWRGEGEARRVVLCRPWILCNETAVSNGARSAREKAECRWIKYPCPLRKKKKKHEKRARARSRNGHQQMHFDFSVLWLLHNGYARGDLVGALKRRLIFPADRRCNLLHARSLRAVPFCHVPLFPVFTGTRISILRLFASLAFNPFHTSNYLFFILVSVGKKCKCLASCSLYVTADTHRATFSEKSPIRSESARGLIFWLALRLPLIFDYRIELSYRRAKFAPNSTRRQLVIGDYTGNAPSPLFTVPSTPAFSQLGELP